MPDAILDRQDKIGFSTPGHRWLDALRPSVERLLRSEWVYRILAFNPKKLEREWEGIIQGRKAFDWRLWRFVNLIERTRQFDIRFD